MTVDLQAFARAFRGSRLLASADDQTLFDLARCATRRSFRRGERAFTTGGAASHAFLVTGGLVKVVRSNHDGNSAIMGLFGPREVVGLPAAVTSGRYPADAVAISEDLTVLLLPADALNCAMARDPKLASSIARVLADHAEALSTRVLIMSAGPVACRLANLLLHLADRFGDELEDGSLCVPVTLQRAELASLVGTTTETTIRTLSRWTKAGVVESNPDGFRITQPKRLQELMARG